MLKSRSFNGGLSASTKDFSTFFGRNQRKISNDSDSSDSDEEYDSDEDDEEASKSRGFFDFLWSPIPSGSSFRALWNATSLVFAIYLLITVPIEAFILPHYAFWDEDAPKNLTVLNSFDTIVDIFFVMDFWMRLKYFDDHDIVIETIQKKSGKTVYKLRDLSKSKNTEGSKDGVSRDSNGVNGSGGSGGEILWGYLEESLFWADLLR